MEKLKTGTTTLGIICKDGIVIAADKRTTAGGFIVRKDADKITQVSENIAVTTAGSVSDIQMFIKLFRAELKLKLLKNGRIPTVKEAANFASRIAYENARQYFPSIAQILVAGYDKTSMRIYEVDVDGAMLEIKEYVSTGSGSIIVYGVLENAYRENMTIKEGEDLAVKCVSSAMQRDTGSGNGIDVLVITKDGMKKTIQKKLTSTYTDR